MLKKVLAIFATAATVSILANPAEAVTVTFGSTTYDITTVTGSFNSFASTLQSQVWWGNVTTATFFANQVGNSLGLPNLKSGNIGTAGPLFAFELVPTTSVRGRYVASGLGNIPGLFFVTDATITYAVATPTAIPTPALLPALIGFGVAVVRKHGKNLAEV